MIHCVAELTEVLDALATENPNQVTALGATLSLHQYANPDTVDGQHTHQSTGCREVAP